MTVYTVLARHSKDPLHVWVDATFDNLQGAEDYVKVQQAELAHVELWIASTNGTDLLIC